MKGLLTPAQARGEPLEIISTHKHLCSVHHLVLFTTWHIHFFCLFYNLSFFFFLSFFLLHFLYIFFYYSASNISSLLFAISSCFLGVIPLFLRHHISIVYNHKMPYCAFCSFLKKQG